MRMNQFVRPAARIVLCIAAVMIIFTAAAGVKTMAAQTYIVNGVELPLNEKGYKVGDYRGAGMCWQFARHIYYLIWDRFFYQDPGTDDDLLRDYPAGEARRITAENARLFISAAPLGAVIRLQQVTEGSDAVACNRHSLILLAKDENGCTVYHDWSGIATISELTWEEFENHFAEEVDFGYFKYIKYPGADSLRYRYSAIETEKELVISSRIYGLSEISERKR